MSEEQANQNITQDSAPAEAPASEAPAPAAETSAPDFSQYEQQIQAQNQQIAQQSQQLQEFQDQFLNNPLMQAFQQASQPQQPTNPFEQELGLQNLPDATKYAYQQNVQTSERVQQLEEQLGAMQQERMAMEYQNTLSGLRDQWKGIYGSPDGETPEKVNEAIDNAIWKSIESDPMLAAQANQALSEQGYLDNNFLKKVEQKMDSDIAAAIKDPNKREGFLKTLVQQELRRKDLQNQSMLSSNIETSDSGKKTDSFSATFIADE